MAENRDSFEFSVGMSGFTLKAQGKVTALLSAMMSIGALSVAAYFAQEAFLPMMKKKMQIEDGEEEREEGGSQVARLRIRTRRSAPVPDSDDFEADKQLAIDTSDILTERRRPVYVAAGISIFAVVTSIYFGRRAWMNLATQVTKLPRSE